MSENKLKEFIISSQEKWVEFKENLNQKKDELAEILSENMFVSGYENLFAEGVRTFSKKRYKRAIYYFEKASREERNNFKCLYNLGLSYQADGDYKKAIQNYLDALKQHSDDFDTIYNLGLSYLNDNQGENAEKYLKMALEKNRSDTEVKMSYILALIKCNRVDDAIECTIEIVKSNKTYLDYTLVVAKYIEEISFGEKDTETISKVIKLLNSYLKINDKSSTAHLQTSMCYGKIGNWDMALKHSLKALELDPKSFEINSHTALVLYCSHNYEEALKYYEKALFLQPVKNFDTHYNIALTYEKLEQYDNLTAKAEYILKHFKNHPQINAVKLLLKNNSEEQKSKQEKSKNS